VLRRRDANGKIGDCLGLTVLILMILAVLLFGGIEQNPGPVVEVENAYVFLWWVQQESEIRNPV
jgi:hypothetical protein